MAKMKAYRINKLGEFPRLEDVEIPKPKNGEILIRMAGAGLCRTDLEVIDHGFNTLKWEGPFTLGHENAGYVEELGEGVTGFEIGEAVIVSTIHSCGHCEMCKSGNDNYCENVSARGLKEDGGMAEYMIADQRELVSLGDLEPSEYVALADAGLTPYRAVKYAQPKIPGDGVSVVIGTGGLGFFAIQFLAQMTSSRIIAVNRTYSRMVHMTEYGADDLVLLDDNTIDNIMELTDGKGVNAVFDFVGSDQTLEISAKIAKSFGVVSIMGLGGGSLPVNWTTLKPGVEVRISQGGTLTDLKEIIGLAKMGKIQLQLNKYPFSKLDQALNDLRDGKISGRAVLTFEEFAMEEGDAAGASLE